MQMSVRLALLLLTASLGAHAGEPCSRPINVPISQIGLSVFTTPDGAINGVYPDLLKKIASQDGCNFLLSEVPRARLESLYEAGQLDILIPASRTPRRDQFGIFVPLIQSRAMVISLASPRPAIASLQDLLERRELKVALVRAFDFGPAYQTLVAELNRQGRVVFERDTAAVARLLQSGVADVTIMAPSILVGALTIDTKTPRLVERLRVEPLAELPWGESGVYISRTALNDHDRDLLRELLERAAKTGVVWKAFQQHYPANALTGSIKPR
jgi:polar amino acid transport system substrate-binding protein